MTRTSAMLKARLPFPRFLSAGEVLMGPESLVALKALDAARIAVCASRSLIEKGGQERLDKVLRDRAWELFILPQGEPELECLAPVGQALSAFAPDWIVAVGGGSVLDAAKVLWALYEHPELSWELLTRPFALPALRGRARFCAVPTTAGTGSEVSSAALLLRQDGGKAAVVSHELLPDVAILDPTLLFSLPVSAAVFAGLDSLAHALESYVSQHTNPMADQLSEQAATTLFRELPKVARMLADADADGLLELQLAALMAGWAQNHKVPGVGHALAHQMTPLGLAHGEAAGLWLPHSMRFNAGQPTAASKLNRLGHRLGFADGQGLMEAVDRLLQELSVTWPVFLPDALRSHEERIIAGALQDLCAKANPMPLDADNLRQLLWEVSR